ncbi:porin family protein, partial [Methylobacterium sp. J-076]|nr:porin family protein [Methylobacterium sp. J-076]
MNKLLLASTVLAGMTVAASAADLPRRAAPPPVFTLVAFFTWTGFYAGFNAGYGFDSSTSRATAVVGVSPANGIFAADDRPTTVLLFFSNRNNNECFVGGGQICYNYY